MPELTSVLLAEKAITVAPEHDRPDIVQARAELKQSRQPRKREHRGRLIFQGETSPNTKMTKATGRCLKGEWLLANAPFAHWAPKP